MTDLSQPWLEIPNITLNDPRYDSESLETDIIVIGAGIAGASVAYHCAQLGYRVSVLDRAPFAATEGSGNRQGMLYAKLSPHTRLENEWALLGLDYSLQLLHKLTEEGMLQKGRDWDDCGLLQLAYASKKPEYQLQLAAQYPEIMQVLTQSAASHLAGISLCSGGLFFPQAGWVAPRALTEALLQHPFITFLPKQQVVALRSLTHKKALPLWEVMTTTGTYRSKSVVLAMAKEVCTLKVCENLPIQSARGQTTSINQTSPLKIVVSGEGYVAPSLLQDGQMWTTFGATFRRNGEVSAPTAEEHWENSVMLQQNSKALAQVLGIDKTLLLDEIEGRVALRAFAPGSLPIVGPIAQYDEFMARFAAIRLDAKRIPDVAVPWHYGLYLSTAHGARGMISAPIAGRMIQYMIGKTVEDLPQLPPISDAIYRALHPNRFYFQQLRSGKMPD